MKYCSPTCRDIAKTRRKASVPSTFELVLTETWRADLRAGVARWERETQAALNAYEEAQVRFDALLYAAMRQGADDHEIGDITELRVIQVRDRVRRFVAGLHTR